MVILMLPEGYQVLFLLMVYHMNIIIGIILTLLIESSYIKIALVNTLGLSVWIYRSFLNSQHDFHNGFLISVQKFIIFHLIFINSITSYQKELINLSVKLSFSFLSIIKYLEFCLGIFVFITRTFLIH